MTVFKFLSSMLSSDEQSITGNNSITEDVDANHVDDK